MPERLRRRLGVLATILPALIAVMAVPRASAAADAGAGRPKRVLLIVDRASDPFAERIGAELEGLGLETVVLESWRQPERGERMEAEARERHASAAIRLLASRRGVEIWMADETSGRSLLRQLIVDNSPGGPDENLVAMQLVELLRTSLLVEPHHPQEEVRPPAPPQPPIQQPATTDAPASCPSFWARCVRVQAGAGPLASGGGTGVVLQAWVSLQASFGRRLGVGLDLGVPIVSGSISGPEGSATIRTHTLGLAALVRLDSQRSRLSAVAGAGAELVRVSAEGQAKQPLAGSSPSVLSPAGYVRLDGGLDITHWLRIVARVTAGAALDRVEIRFAGNDAARWGRLFAAGMLMLDAGWR